MTPATGTGRLDSRLLPRAFKAELLQAKFEEVRRIWAQVDEFHGSDDDHTRPTGSVQNKGQAETQIEAVYSHYRTRRSSSGSAVTLPSKPARSQLTNCTGDCQSCAWNFQCKSASGSIGRSVPASLDWVNSP
jgi:hypothetical protein